MKAWICILPNESYEKSILLKVAKRLINGADLTICHKEQECWVNKWLKDPEKISVDVAEYFINTGFVGVDSGNTKTNEVHYNFFSGEHYEGIKRRFDNDFIKDLNKLLADRRQ